MSLKSKHFGVALSGGIDSAIAAFLLKEAGYKVTGHHFLLESENKEKTEKAIEDAERVAKTLGIEFFVHEFSKEFKKVKDSFFSSYVHGRTPNPCVLCNRIIKFGAFQDKILSFGADGYATGHYARVKKDGECGIRLLCSKDLKRDQSYFLAWVPKERFKHIEFPLGKLRGKKVLNTAKKCGLGWLINKEHSMEICFAGKNYRETLKQEGLGFGKKGRVITKNGEVLGFHEGIGNYTVGQRKGLPPYKEPLFVLNIDTKTGDIVVGSRKDLERKEFFVAGVNKLSDKFPSEVYGYIKIRNTSKGIKGRWSFLKNNRALIRLDYPEAGISPGQLAVLYKNREVVASGIIQPYRS